MKVAAADVVDIVEAEELVVVDSSLEAVAVVDSTIEAVVAVEQVQVVCSSFGELELAAARHHTDQELQAAAHHHKEVARVAQVARAVQERRRSVEQGMVDTGQVRVASSEERTGRAVTVGGWVRCDRWGGGRWRSGP